MISTQRHYVLAVPDSLVMLISLIQNKNHVYQNLIIFFLGYLYTLVDLLGSIHT